MDYYSFVRSEILSLLPPHASRALEIGCGNGATLAWLKQQGMVAEVTGIEYQEQACAQAVRQLDCVYCGDVERMELRGLGKFELILCLDVLEHLQDPWRLLRRLQALLKPEGRLIVSLPNVRHHSVILPLLLYGRWPYAAAGILDRSHLRFFTRASAQHMLEDSGFAINACRANGQQWAQSRLARWLGRWRLAEPFCAVQYLFAAQVRN